jgi:hypothetical protein
LLSVLIVPIIEKIKITLIKLLKISDIKKLNLQEP